MATSGDFRGHQRLPQMAATGDFLMATDTRFWTTELQPPRALARIARSKVTVIPASV
jgi:hypothetical protein